MIYIIDFGGRTAHQIVRIIREFGLDHKFLQPNIALDEIKSERPDGIIFSGGPDAVFEDGAANIDKKIYDLGIPIFGICYGCQLIVHHFSGVVENRGNSEYGPTQICFKSKMDRDNNLLFDDLNDDCFQVWMSHSDDIGKLPDNFISITKTKNVDFGDIRHKQKDIYGVLFHPEVSQGEFGKRILANFVHNICGLEIHARRIESEKIIQDSQRLLHKLGFSKQDKKKLSNEDISKRDKIKAIAAVSGGVDSTVTAVIASKVFGPEHFMPIYCDSGLMRPGNREKLNELFLNKIGIKPLIVECEQDFLKALKGVTDPEEKRIKIGHVYSDIFKKEAQKYENVEYLVQGTIYSDLVESKSKGATGGVKSHHNVSGLSKKLGLKVFEPLKYYYKDEVRELAKQLKLSDYFIKKHPMPGPGHAIRIIGEVTAKRLAKQQQADQIVIEELKNSGWYDQVFQAFTILTGVKTTAVMGDARVFAELIGLRVYGSKDILTAGWSHLPYEVLQSISTRIVNEVPDVSRVVYDITTKPPATMEWM